jgi:dihydrofolate reductase
MKLTTTTHVSLDGVMQGLGGADEDRSGGFERGGWAIPLFDNEAEAFLLEVFGRADAYLFGRKTYDIFAGYWGVMDPSESAIAEALNTKPKYVASSTLTEPEWDDTTVLSDDVATAVAELKAKPGGELQVHGSGALIRSWTTTSSTRSTCSPIPWSSARARGCSPTPARTERSS